MHPQPGTVLQDVESVAPLEAGCVIFQGSAMGGVGWSRSPDVHVHLHRSTSQNRMS